MPSQKKMCLLSGKYPIIQYTQLQMCHKYEDVIKVYGIKRDGFSFFNFREICFWPKWHIRQGLDLFSHLKQLNTKQNILIIFKTLALREKKDRDRKQTVWVLWLPRSEEKSKHSLATPQVEGVKLGVGRGEDWRQESYEISRDFQVLPLQSSTGQ